MTLIERLQAATGPDRALDGEIAVAIANPTDRVIEMSGCLMPGQLSTRHSEYYVSAPNFTGSLDAARSICKDAFPTLICTVCGKQMVRLIKQSDQPSFEYTGIGKTIELAWCIAALIARGVK